MKNLLKINLNSQRIYGLDVLRALAILFVVIGHGRYLLPEGFQFAHKLIVFDGVSIFFVLSGFLIGGILIQILETKEANGNLIVDFWIRRWFRTLPNYFLILLTLVTLHALFSEGFSLWYIKRYFIFSQNLFYEQPSFFPEAWSLSIEEWFYILIPSIILILIVFAKLSTKQSVIITALSVLLIIMFFRFIRYLNVSIDEVWQWDLIYRKQVFTRLDSLMFGVIGAYVKFYKNQLWLKNKKLFLYLGISLFLLTKSLDVLNMYPIGGFYNCVFSFSFTSLATLFLLPFLSDLKTGKGVIFKGLTYISLISYSMYLLNLSIVQTWIIGSIDWNNWIDNVYLIAILKYSIYWLLTVVLSILIYKYFEMPMMKLRDSRKFMKLAPATKSH